VYYLELRYREDTAAAVHHFTQWWW